MRTQTFDGAMRGPDGRVHVIHRVECVDCGVVLSEMHLGCCGHASCGFGRHKCDCKEEKDGEVGF